MISKRGLIKLGFSDEQVEKLLKDKIFVLKVKKKNDQKFAELFRAIQRTYKTTAAQIVKVISRYPPFEGYPHRKVINNIKKTYGITEELAKKVIFSYPSFVGLNHSRAINDIKKTYGITTAQAKKAIITFTRFAGYNHARVLRQTVRMGRIIGLKKQEAIEAILNNPVLAGYSQRRNLASIDAFRNAVKTTGSTKTSKELFEIYQKSFAISPYPVKGSKKRETQWQRKGNRTQSKMGRVIEKRLKDTKRKIHRKHF